MTDVTNRQIAQALEEIADLLDILGEDGFRVSSYRKVARVVGESGEDVASLARDGKAIGLPGIGKGSAEKIAQLVTHGTIDLLEELRGKVPPGLVDLLSVPHLGPKTVSKLWREAGITDRGSLAEALEENRLDVAGIGPKKNLQIWNALKFTASAAGRLRLDDADAHVRRLIGVLEEIPGVQRPTAAGSFRRGRETVGDLDILCQADPPDKAGEIIEAFTRVEELKIKEVLAAGRTKASVRLEEGAQADLRVVPAESFGAALQYFTGSKEHNVRLRELAVSKGFKLNEYGLFQGDRRVAGDTEASIYEALGLPWISPELREGREEIPAAQAGALPTLLELSDIKGDLHMHTTASDGVESIETMILACAARGYHYMAIADHSKSQVQAHGLDAVRLAEHGKAIAAAAGEAQGINVYFSCEVDVFKDGDLDFPDKVLRTLDIVIASPHSALSQNRAAATKRLIKAIENPHVRVIGHPSGRLINTRQGMELGIAEIAAAAAEQDVALEINAHPYRLDLRDTHVMAAIDAGAKIIINTDAHSVADLDNMRFGVATARRGWAQAVDVVNAWPAKKFDKWVKSRRK